MEPIVLFEAGFAAALCVVFLIYGAWLCLSELVLGQPEQAPQKDEHSSADTSVDAAEPQ